MHKNTPKMKETVKNLQKRGCFCRKMKESEKNSSKNKKIFKKGVDKPKRIVYNSNISFIFQQFPRIVNHCTRL